MGNMTDTEKRLLTVPFFSKGAVGEKLAGRFQKLQQTILNRKENDPHALNPKNVTGIWYLSGLQYELSVRNLLNRRHRKRCTLTTWNIFCFRQSVFRLTSFRSICLLQIMHKRCQRSMDCGMATSVCQRQMRSF